MPFKIFLLDDDVFCLALCQQQLENLGHTDISVFTDSESCIKNLTAQPDIVFIEPETQNYKGIEILKRIKQFSHDIYVVFMSAEENEKAFATALKHGVFDHILKADCSNGKLKDILERINKIQTMLRSNNTSVV